MAEPVPARISENGRLVDRVVQVRKNRNEDVAWVAQDGGGPWTIRFDVPFPFRYREYPVPQGDSVRTEGGPVNGVEGQSYRYEVIDSTGAPTDHGFIEVVASLAEVAAI
jgi:hypothetical protein